LLSGYDKKLHFLKLKEQSNIVFIINIEQQMKLKDLINGIKEKFLLLTTDEFKKWLESKEVIRPIRFIQNYYTVIPIHASFNGHNHFQMLKRIEEYQKITYGYNEIAQNITVFPYGIIGICRNVNRCPEVPNGTNKFIIRVDYVGDHVKKNIWLRENLLDHNVWLNAILSMKFHINSESIPIINPPQQDIISMS
jgi:hypothetical protein